MSKRRKRVDTSVIGGKLQGLGFETYEEYLRSDHWQDARRRYSESDLPQRCKCGRPRQALHHTTYERLGEEELTDLQAVCHDCHQKLHRRSKPKKSKPKGNAKPKKAKKKRKAPYRPYRPRRSRKPREEPAERRRRLASQVFAEQSESDAA